MDMMKKTIVTFRITTQELIVIARACGHRVPDSAQIYLADSQVQNSNDRDVMLSWQEGPE